MPWGKGPSVLGKGGLLWKAKDECWTDVLKVQDLGRLVVDSTSTEQCSRDVSDYLALVMHLNITVPGWK